MYAARYTYIRPLTYTYSSFIDLLLLPNGPMETPQKSSIHHQSSSIIRTMSLTIARNGNDKEERRVSYRLEFFLESHLFLQSGMIIVTNFLRILEKILWIATLYFK